MQIQHKNHKKKRSYRNLSYLRELIILFSVIYHMCKLRLRSLVIICTFIFPYFLMILLILYFFSLTHTNPKENEKEREG